MKSVRLGLWSCLALTFYALGCSEAEPAPSKAALHVQISDDPNSSDPCGVITSVRSMPLNDPDVARLSAQTSQQEAEALAKMKDGADNTAVSCTVTELSPGAYQVSLDSNIKNGQWRFSIRGQTGTGTGYLSFKSPDTLNTYSSDQCTITADANGQFEGGGAIKAAFSCPQFHEESQTTQACLAVGNFLIEDCSK